MAVERFLLDDADIEDLAALARNGDNLSDLLAKSEELGPRIGTVEMARTLSKSLSADAQEVLQVISGLLLLRSMAFQRNRSNKAISKEIAISLKEKAESEAVEAWNAARDKIVEAVDTLKPEHPLVVSYQAGSAAQQRSRIVTSMEMFTDTRSIFNESKDQILFSIISHTLILEYHKGFRRHAEIQLSLDAADLINLSALCERALSEADALKRTSTVPTRSPFELESEE